MYVTEAIVGVLIRGVPARLHVRQPEVEVMSLGVQQALTELLETGHIVQVEAHVPCQTIRDVADQINITELQHREAAPIAEEHGVLQTEAAIGVLLLVDLPIPGLPILREVRGIEVRVEVLPGIQDTDRVEVLQGVPVTAPAGVVLPEVQEFVLPAEVVQEVLVA